MSDFLKLSLALSVVAAWVTHLYITITAKAWLFLIAGAIAAPIGVIHGYASWLGFDWLG